MLGALLGGLAGILFPSAGAAAGGAAATGIGALLGRAALPAIGAGLGTLVTGGSGKDAIRNALLMGAGTAAFPGLASGIQQSGLGQNITGGLADLFGMAGGGPEQGAPAPAPTMSSAGVRPQPRPAGLGQMPPAPAFETSGRQPVAMPTISEIASMDRQRMEDRAARDFDMASRFPRSQGFAKGGAIEGPGTGTSDSIPATIFQDGKPVRKAALSDGEFVMTAKAVKGAGNGSRDRGITRMYELMRRFERGEMA